MAVVSKEKVILVIPYYRDKRKERRWELDCVLRKNIGNKLIDQIITVIDNDDSLPLLRIYKTVTIINIGRRQMFSDLSNIANAINHNGINIIANADVYFKQEDIEKIKKIDYTNTVLALSRWDVKKKGNPKLHEHKDSQDVWIFKGRLNINGDFLMGTRGIDNRIAYEIGKNYNIINPSLSIKSYHLHLTEMRNYTAKSIAVPPPYLRVPICYYTDKKIKKVLHVGLNYKGQTELNNTLKSFGKYEFFDWQKYLELYGVWSMRQHLLRLNKEFKPDLVFMQIQTPDIIDGLTASKLSGTTLNWTGDVRSNTDWLRNLAPYVDATCLTNETDTEALREEGVNSWFLQIGFEHKIFTSEGPKLTTKNTIHSHPDVVFMGNNYPDKFPLSKERHDIVHKLKQKYSNRFLLCGQGWDLEAINLMGQPKKEAMVYRSCKIAINANHFLHKRFSSDRIFRIMGSGAFCLTRHYPGIEKDFIDGVHLKTFNTIEEMLYLIEYYLKHEGERMDISEAGCKLVHEKFKWQDNKRLIQQIASFPQDKIKVSEKIITKPMDNRTWRKFLKEPD